MTVMRFSKDHEWVRVEGGIATVGISVYAQEQLGDVVFVELPAVGRQVKAGDEAAVVESVKAASEVYAPVSGEVTEVNSALADTPALVNEDAEGKGWFMKIKLADPKEVAEHVMLIDLGRNDIGRVATPGTVRVTEQLVIERYSHVMHISSNVEGTLAEGKDAIDVLRATLPVGTLSGAPKIRAMEIIDSLEPVKRGIYGGAVGYLSWTGNMDTAIAIRTAVIRDGRLYIQAGCGVVADSVPRLEWEETLNKGRAMFRAVAMAERGLTTD